MTMCAWKPEAGELGPQAHLACISPISPLYLPSPRHISPISPLYLLPQALDRLRRSSEWSSFEAVVRSLVITPFEAVVRSLVITPFEAVVRSLVISR